MSATHAAMIICALLALAGLSLWADEWRQRARDRRTFKLNPMFKRQPKPAVVCRWLARAYRVGGAVK